MNRLLFLLAMVFQMSYAFSQSQHEPVEYEHKAKHSVAILIGHTHVPKGFEDANKSEALIVPSWGMNYNFNINERWSIGWHNDMEISTYKIIEDDGTELERERPVISSIVGTYRPSKLVGIVLGFGREFERHQSFWVFRTGIEFEIEINNQWNLSPGLAYDLKEAVYDSWSLGLAVGRHF